jgi:tetratricopeptide (TPR) repeat protein
MFWATHPFEGMHRWEALLSAAAAPALPAELRACALRVAGVSTFFFGRVTEGRRLFEESRAEYQRLGNDIGIAVVLNLLSIAAIRVGELEEARSLAGESRSISARVGFKKGEARVLVTLGHVEFQEGNHERGLAELERGAALAGDLGLSFMQAETYRWLALYTYDLGRRHDAEHWARRALALEHRMGERHGTVNSLALLARIATDIGDRGRAGRLWGAIEREEQQGPLGEWDADRDELAAAVLARPEPALETGRVEGRQLSLDEAVTYALSDFD